MSVCECVRVRRESESRRVFVERLSRAIDRVKEAESQRGRSESETKMETEMERQTKTEHFLISVENRALPKIGSTPGLSKRARCTVAAPHLPSGHDLSKVPTIVTQCDEITEQ